MRKALLALLLVTGACGDDDPPPPPKPGQAGAPGSPQAAQANKDKLQTKIHVEDRIVHCPLPDKPDGPACSPDAPTCEAGKYCLQFNTQYFCEPCPERDSIRHEFRERDFVAEQDRDPFQSFVILQKGLTGPNEPVAEPTKHCTRDDQFVAGNYGFTDLKLVGIVSQGTQRKALMEGGKDGYIVKRGDCVGKEKAVVKEIGTGYLVFQVDADPASKRPPEEKAVQLHELPAGMQQDGGDHPR